jgi:tetratricopeptide (TPR) repeat protein
MMEPANRRLIELEPGSPIADTVARADKAFTRADATGVDAEYREAVRLAAGNPTLWSALAMDHAEKLRMLRCASLALRRCDEYLHQAGPNDIPLRVQRAEIYSSLGNHSSAGADAATIRAALENQSYSLSPDDDARLHRVEGLSAAAQGDLLGAIHHLDAAWGLFIEVDDRAGVAAIELDRLILDVREGGERAVSEVIKREAPQTVSEYCLLALAFRRQLRYEEALLVLLHAAVAPDLDPALRWPVMYDLILTLRLLRQDGTAERLLPLLEEAAAVSADPTEAAAAVARVGVVGVPSDAVSPQFDRRIQQVRRLIADTELDHAESLLIEFRSQARTDRDISTWHLAAGELELVRYEISGTVSFAQDAVGHLGNAANHASTMALLEVRACALGLLGDAWDVLGKDDRAVECWAEAHRLEELIAGRQITDNARIGMLMAVPDEYDKQIQSTAKRLRERAAEAATVAVVGDASAMTGVSEATAAIVVAMEAARGATILERILPGEAGLVRHLPRPNDLKGAWRWVDHIARRLPRSQVVWIMHSTPDRVHHAILGQELLYHISVPSRRDHLTSTIDGLMDCWSTDENLEASIVDGQFEKLLDEVAAQVGVDAVLPKLPPHVRRIAIVAGDALSDIPFAAVKIRERLEPIGLQFALSDLPCLSAQLPLHRRARRLRGDRLLVVSPPADGITRAATRRGCTVLDGELATLRTLRAELGLHRHHQVRIDCHGQHEHREPMRSWLQLAPAGSDGQLRPEDLQWMDLRGCGTLIIGACESGMAQRKGRDERIGFVRAAVHAGAPAVIAARWLAHDVVAAIVLDHFERYVRYLPRDLALQRAQFDACRAVSGMPGVSANIPAIDHPARWACWTLYGDSGWQTSAGPLRRSLRHRFSQWRRHAAHS